MACFVNLVQTKSNDDDVRDDGGEGETPRSQKSQSEVKSQVIFRFSCSSIQPAGNGLSTSVILRFVSLCTLLQRLFCLHSF